MQLIESEITEVASLRKQVKLMAIVLFGACFLLLALSIRELASHHPSPTAGWQNLSANKLQVKQLVLMTDDGRAAGFLKVIHGSPGLVLLDAKGEICVFLTTAGNSGLIALSQEGASRATYLKSGEILMGDEKIGGVLIESPPVGQPVVKVFDSSGYSGALGRSAVVNKADGSETVTSAASLVGSSRDSTSALSLISQPPITPAVVSELHGKPKKASSRTPSKRRN